MFSRPLLLLLHIALANSESFVDSESLGSDYRLPRSDTARLSSEILHLLDLDSDLPPTSSSHSSHSAHRPHAPAVTAFMQDVYRELESEPLPGRAKGLEFAVGGGPRMELRTAGTRASALQLRYNVSAWLEDSLHAADLIVSVPQDESVRFSSWEQRQRRLIFRFDHLRRRGPLSVISAELRLFRSDFAYSGERMQLVLQRLSTSLHVLDQITSQLLPGQTGWLEVNVSSFVRNWMDRPRENAGIYIRLLNERGYDLPPDLLGFETSPERPFSPFVVASLREEEGGKRRHRRSAPVFEKTARVARKKRQAWSKNPYVKRTCGRRELRVDFKDLNWDQWVIAPRIYSAYYCGGDCPIPLHPAWNITNHSIVQTLLSLSNQQRHRRPVPRPCCVPVALQSMKMLYFDRDKRVMLRTYHDMKVEACGCH